MDESFMDVDQGDFLSPEMIIKAEKVSKYTSSCSLINDILEIKVIDTTTNVVYIKHIDNSSPFWVEDGKIFQNNIKKLYDILTMCFNGTYQDITLGSGMDWSFEIASNDMIRMKIYYEGIFGFNVSIKIPKENTEVDKLRNVIIDLKSEIELLQKKYSDLNDNYNKRLTDIEKLLEIRIKPL